MEAATQTQEEAASDSPSLPPPLFVYFLSGVNIYAWLQPSHLHMSQPANTLRARTNIPQLSGIQSQTFTIQPFKPDFNLFPCMNPAHSLKEQRKSSSKLATLHRSSTSQESWFLCLKCLVLFVEFCVE